MFTKIAVGVSPRGTVRDNIVGTCCAELGDHQRRRGCWHDDSAVQVEGTSGMDSSEASITATGGEDVWLRASGELFKAAEDVVANPSVKLSVWVLRSLIIGMKLTVI